jgi:small subunit ribosomal protein S6
MLVKHGAVLGYQEFLGKKKLAYPINKIAHGYYLVLEFELADGQALKEINNLLRLDKQILRSLIISKKKITSEEIARQKQEAQEEKNESTREKPAEEKTSKKTESKKASLENLDEKLDELLKTDDLV